jgi:hypothetical protein
VRPLKDDRENSEEERKQWANKTRRSAQNFLMRTYPHGLRISSSNLNPLNFWRDGVQMVALNWQKCDKGMMLNEGMFAGEGGWVLKPPGFRGSNGGRLHHDQLRQLSISGSASGAKQVDLAIQIFAAQDVPLPPDEDKAEGLRPYVKCNLHLVKCDHDDAFAAGSSLGHSGREAAKQVKKTKSRRGVNPDYGGETLAFSSVANVIEELSFLRSVDCGDIFPDYLYTHISTPISAYWLRRCRSSVRLLHAIVWGTVVCAPVKLYNFFCLWTQFAVCFPVFCFFTFFFFEKNSHLSIIGRFRTPFILPLAFLLNPHPSLSRGAAASLGSCRA